MKDEKGLNDLIEKIKQNVPAVIITHPDGMDTDNFIYEVLRAIPGALAEIMNDAEPEVDGKTKRAELFGLFISTMKHVPEREGSGVADGVTIPAHYRLKLRPHKGMLDKFKKRFNAEVRK